MSGGTLDPECRVRSARMLTRGRNVSGGHHFRAWKQNGTQANSGAWFIGFVQNYSYFNNVLLMLLIFSASKELVRYYIVDELVYSLQSFRTLANTTLSYLTGGISVSDCSHVLSRMSRSCSQCTRPCVGRDWFVNNAIEGTHYRSRWWKAEVEWRTDLLDEGSKGTPSNEGLCVHEFSSTSSPKLIYCIFPYRDQPRYCAGW